MNLVEVCIQVSYAPMLHAKFLSFKLEPLLVCMQPEHELQDKGEVLALLLRHPQGLSLGQVRDAYKGVEEDIKVCIPAMTMCHSHTWLYMTYSRCMMVA